MLMLTHEAHFVARALELADSGVYPDADPILVRLYEEAPEATKRWFGAYLYQWIGRRCAEAQRTLQAAS
ncbi:MAG TPA: hypothetical protein VG943_09045 [Caulobacterales bacterium]|nr:hypothetical protein [Caulobacterales bacterium]